MDLKALMDGSDGRWTEKRHSLFLIRMEADFVRRVLGGDAAVSSPRMETDGDLRLDRYIPDSATESTNDSWSLPPPAAAAAEAVEAEVEAKGEVVFDSEPLCASVKSRKRRLAQICVFRDQVVPEIENEKDGDGGCLKRKHGKKD